MIRKSHQVGTLNLKDVLPISLSHEVAAWFTEVQMKSGDYQLHIGYNSHNQKHHLFITDPEALITEDSTPSMFGGVAYSEGNSDKGKLMSQSKTIPNSAEGILHGHNSKVDYTASLNVEFIKFPEDGKGKLEVDTEHPKYQALIKEEKREQVIEALTSKRVSPELSSIIKDNNWEDPNKIDELIDAGVAEHTLNSSWNDKFRSHDDIIRQFGGMIKTDALLRNYYDTSLDSEDIDVSEVYKIYKSKGGEVSNFPAMTVKTMSDLGMVQYTKPELDSDNTY